MYKLSFEDSILIDGVSIDIRDERFFLNDIKRIVPADSIHIKEYNGCKTYSLYCEYSKIFFKFSIKFFNSERYGNPYLVYVDNNGEISWTNDISILRKTLILK